MNILQKIVCILVLIYNQGVFAQNDFVPPTTDTILGHSDCATALLVCKDGSISAAFSTLKACQNALVPQYFLYQLPVANGVIQLNTSTHTGTYDLYGPFSEDGLNMCNQIALGQANDLSDSLNGNISIHYSAPGYYLLKVTPDACICADGRTEGDPSCSIFIQTNSSYTCCSERQNCFPIDTCKDCISSFSPTPGNYVFSAWTKGEQQNENSTYTYPSVDIDFNGVGSNYTFNPSGNIIDGWQRIDGSVTVPQGATNIKITFKCASGDCYFDDIRFLPFDGKMISYVYDPITLKMVAELDERNYATFYEYDEEGKLIRIKKETERGVMTIQENRENLHQ